MGFAQSDGLTGCYRFTPQPQMSIPPLLGCVTKKKKRSSLITVVGEQVALSQCATTIGNTGWYAAPNVRQAIHGPVGHLSAADNSWRHIFTDLWPPLRGTPHEAPRAHMRVHTHESTPTYTTSASVKTVFHVFSKKNSQEKEHKKCVFGDERSNERSMTRLHGRKCVQRLILLIKKSMLFFSQTEINYKWAEFMSMLILGAAQSGGRNLNGLFEFIHKWNIHAGWKRKHSYCMSHICFCSNLTCEYL